MKNGGEEQKVMTKRTHGIRYRLILILLVLVSWAAPATAQLLPPILPGPTQNATTEVATPKRYIVTAPGGISVVQILCSLFGCSLIESLEDPLSQVFVITTSVVDDVLYGLLDLLGIVRILQSRAPSPRAQANWARHRPTGAQVFTGASYFSAITATP